MVAIFLFVRKLHLFRIFRQITNNILEMILNITESTYEFYKPTWSNGHYSNMMFVDFKTILCTIAFYD